MSSAAPYIRTALRYLAVAALIGLFVVAIMNSGSGLPAGTQAPPIVGQRLDGTPFSAKAFNGRPAVINFWATWCHPCLAEIPELQRAYQTYGDRVVFIGLAVESGDRHAVADVAQRVGIGYPVILPHHEVQRAYQVSSFPTTIIVGADGTVVHSHAGAIDYEMLERDLAPLLTGNS